VALIIKGNLVGVSTLKTNCDRRWQVVVIGAARCSRRCLRWFRSGGSKTRQTAQRSAEDDHVFFVD